MAPTEQTRFKSRFSLLSLLPARHPPLQISHPIPQHPPLSIQQPINPARQPHIISLASPISSEYPSPILTSYPETPLRKRRSHENAKVEGGWTLDKEIRMGGGGGKVEEGMIGGRSGRSTGMSPSPKRQPPPPLDLSRTRAVYPTTAALNVLTSGPVHPSTLTRQASTSKPIVKPVAKPPAKAKSSRPTGIPPPEDDPFECDYEFAEIEPGHKYTSWKGGKVDIKPGEVIPRGTLPNLSGGGRGTPTIRGIERLKAESGVVDTPGAGAGTGGGYESVLHNVLLTPTYLRRSPSFYSHDEGGSDLGVGEKGGKRLTMGGKVREAVRRGRESIMPRGVLRLGREGEAERSIREMREREGREMERFKVAGLGRDVESGYGRVVGYESEGTKGSWGKDDVSWRERKRAEEDIKRKQRIWKYSIAIIILCLAALIIGLCTSLLTKSSSSSKPTASASTDSTSSSATATTSAPSTPTSTSESIKSCLSQYTTSQSQPKTYPCSDCVPLLQQTTNDYTTDLVDGNSTGVGAVLQFCALMDMWRGGAGGNGWGEGGSVCAGWDGVTCDARGRVTTLQLKYPNVPATLSSSIGNLVALQELHIMGNNTVPSGSLPTGILQNPALQVLDIEYTSLTATLDFTKAANLSTLYLVNNGNMGKSLPNLAGNTRLTTLAMTGQGLSTLDESNLPTSLTYLDLSYNAFTGAVPPLSSLASLKTLYLTNNQYTQPPQSLPGSITSLSLTSNPSLSGNMPSQICTSSALTTCDLRNTGLGGSTTGQTSLINVTATRTIQQVGVANGTVISSASLTVGTTLAVATNTAKVCGACLFV